MPRNRTTGFTLIEVLLSVGLIAILAAIAILAYRSYIYRAKVAELVDYAQSQTFLVNDYFAKNPVLNSVTSSSCTSIATTTIIGTKITNQYGINNNCQTFANSVANVFGTGVTITAYSSPSMNPDGSLTWICSVLDNGGGISKYAPVTCQNTLPTIP